MSEPRPETAPNREELIALIDRATVPESKWTNRDSAGAQRQLGEGRALLLAGCAFRICGDEDEYTESDAETWWIEITYKGFDHFEIGELSTDTLYIPTEKRLADRAGRDWY